MAGSAADQLGRPRSRWPRSRSRLCAWPRPRSGRLEPPHLHVGVRAGVRPAPSEKACRRPRARPRCPTSAEHGAARRRVPGTSRPRMSRSTAALAGTLIGLYGSDCRRDAFATLAGGADRDAAWTRCCRRPDPCPCRPAGARWPAGSSCADHAEIREFRSVDLQPWHLACWAIRAYGIRNRSIHSANQARCARAAASRCCGARPSCRWPAAAAGHVQSGVLEDRLDHCREIGRGGRLVGLGVDAVGPGAVHEERERDQDRVGVQVLK